MSTFAWPRRHVLLDGGMGRELRFRGVQLSDNIWSASALITAPEVVRAIHVDYLQAGADIITANTYGVIRHKLALEGLADQFASLQTLACALAREAVERVGRPALIAGSLPPLFGSYRPDLVRSFDEIEPIYREHADLVAPHVDLLLCETMSSVAEARAATTAACGSGKPVWVSFTLHEDRSGHLRSGESVAEAKAALANLPICGFLANCCAPESITAAMRSLVNTGYPWVGGYANTFQPIAPDWKLSGGKSTDGVIGLRDDLDADHYAIHAADWLTRGATVIGGCCGTQPAHIAKLRSLLDSAR